MGNYSESEISPKNVAKKTIRGFLTLRNRFDPCELITKYDYTPQKICDGKV
jgi:hypothetical protein